MRRMGMAWIATSVPSSLTTVTPRAGSCSIGAEVEALGTLVLRRHEGVLDGVDDVVVADPVLAGGAVDEHVASIVSRNSC